MIILSNEQRLPIKDFKLDKTSSYSCFRLWHETFIHFMSLGFISVKTFLFMFYPLRNYFVFYRMHSIVDKVVKICSIYHGMRKITSELSHNKIWVLIKFTLLFGYWLLLWKENSYPYLLFQRHTQRLQWKWRTLLKESIEMLIIRFIKTPCHSFLYFLYYLTLNKNITLNFLREKIFISV